MNRFKVIKSLLMNLPVSLTMSFVAQWVNILHGHMQHFEWGSIAISFCFSYFIAFLIAFFYSRGHLGLCFRRKVRRQKGHLDFRYSGQSGR